MLGTRPSDLIPWIDFQRFAELLIDGKEVQPATTAALDLNTRAIALVRSAENDIVDAVRTKQYYSLIQLQDLVRDYQIGGNKGHQIMSLIADLVYFHALTRRRYPLGTPQGEDPSVKRGQEKLQELKTGTKIFVIEGVQATDGAGNVIGVYGGQEKPNAGLMSGSMIKGGIGHPSQVWGTNRKHDFEANNDPFY